MKKPTSCAVCGIPIPQRDTGRPRKYCPPCGVQVEKEQKAIWTRIYRRKDAQPERKKHAR